MTTKSSTQEPRGGRQAEAERLHQQLVDQVTELTHSQGCKHSFVPR
jgi:hypothetical protein